MPSTFADLIARIRAGDSDAAGELVAQYGPAVRVEVRRRMRDARLRRAFDSVDICQSVLASFFFRATLGQYDLDDPSEVMRLLVGMAQNKLAEQVRHQHRQCRDNRRVESLGSREVDAASPEPSPSQIVADRELLLAMREALTDEERAIADRRARGLAWEEIAAELGASAQALRKQLERAADRVARRFGLEDTGDE
jgi:RNA polymerase sigma-70 factor (ECF subfamily)